MSTSQATEKQIPLVLLGVGALILTAKGIFGAGVSGAGLFLMALAVATVVGVGLMLVGCFVTATLFKVSFGDLHAAILKLAAIYVFPSAVGTLIPGVGGLVAAALAFVLLMWLFELELVYAIVFTVVMWVVNIVAAMIIVGIIGR